jgi:uncharacterized membrane protein YheB (UPF0754 family)
MNGINFIIFPVVGAAIGAFTNEVAIKMLFRPYKAVMIGKFRVPFTPGVIPSQREVIAKNIAETFEANLLSGSEIHQVITGDRVRDALDGKVDAFMRDSLGPMGAMFTSYKPKIIAKILEGIEEVATDSIQNGGELHIGQKIEAKINAMDVKMLEDLILGFSRKQFKHITFFGGVLGALIGIVQACLALVTG